MHGSSIHPRENVCPIAATTMRMPLCSELVETPLGEHVSCLEYEDERSRSMSDDQVMLYLFEEFGISDGQQLQRLDKEQRNAILSALLSRRAGVRQLQRLTGIGKNIISIISKTIMNLPGQWLVPLSHKLSKEIRWFILMLRAMCSNSNCGNLSVNKKEYG